MSDAPDIPSPPGVPTGNALRAALVARAKDLIGETAYARAMGVSPRATRYWATDDPGRPVKDGILRDTLRILIEHRQQTGELIKGVRAVLEEGEK